MNNMKEEFLKISNYFDNLAKSYRTLAEACGFSSNLSKDEDMTGGLTEDSSKAEQVTEENKSEGKAVTFEEVSTLAKQKALSGKNVEVKNIIQSLGFKKISEIPAEKYADIIKELEAL